MKNVAPNPETSFQPERVDPRIAPNSYVHPHAVVIGDVEIGAEVMVAPFASIRADEGAPFYIGDRSNVQDGVVIHALETCGEHASANTFDVKGKRYAVYVGSGVSLAHQCQVHGPALVEDNCFIGMQAFVFRSRVGRGTVVEPGAKLMGVTVASGRYVPAGKIVTKQSEADSLPVIDDSYSLKDLNEGVVKVNVELAGGYLQAIPLLCKEGFGRELSRTGRGR